VRRRADGAAGARFVYADRSLPRPISTVRRPPLSAFAERRDRLAASLRDAGSAHVGLGKQTSNLFRDRAAPGKRLLDVRAFDHVLDVDPARGVVDAEGMTTYEALADATLARGVMPAVVPELKTITLGGAAAGVGIEATSFRHGLVHETLVEIEVMSGEGRTLVCRADNEHADLFYGFPNSYGTLGYALRLVARTQPVKPFVAVMHVRVDTPFAFFSALDRACDGDADFVDGVVFGDDAFYITEARFTDAVGAASDYTFEHIYFRSIRERAADAMSARDYLWRWDTDWFWCSKNVGAQVPWLRRLYGRARLNSRTYQKIMRLNARLGVTRAWSKLRGGHHESVIQDVDIPLPAAPQFLDFFLREIRVLPMWICPVTTSAAADRFVLYPMRPSTRYVNFGFWDVLHRERAYAPGHFNRLIEAEVQRLGGIKSLYSDSYFERATFDAIYGGAAYRSLKARYDPHGAFPGLYDKCVLRR
jgi:FAD/FMN-containing dehydrogenase